MANKLSIKSLLEKRAEIPFSRQSNDWWVNQIIEYNSDVVYFVTTFGMSGSNNIQDMYLNPVHHLNRSDIYQRDILLKYYEITAVFGLSNSIKNISEDLMLLVLIKKHSKLHTNNNKLFIGNYEQKLYQGNCNRHDLSLEDTEATHNFPFHFDEYCNKIENWMNNGEPATDGTGYWFNQITGEDFDFNNISPLPYSKRKFEIREFLKTAKRKRLYEIAEIIKPRSIKDEMGKIVGAKDFKYPLNYDNIRIGWITDTELKIGDIVFKGGILEKSYMLIEQPSEKIYAGASDYVVRTNNLDMSAYIIMFFTTDVGKEVLGKTSTENKMSFEKFRRLTIIEPEKTIKFNYFSTYEKLNTVPDDMSDYNMGFFAAPKLTTVANIEDVLNIELIEKLKIYKIDLLHKFLIKDFAELNTCYRSKAYKATMILCGSILEAVLLDWLSEIHKTNYFEKKMMVIDRRSGREVEGQLIHMIDEIEAIKRPKWMSESQNAHKIRKKRNYVHAKLCMRRTDINEKTCKEVIGYLKGVLRTRGL